MDKLLHLAFDAIEEAAAACGIPLSTSPPTSRKRGEHLDCAQFVARGAIQAGTLGSGNHFIELLAGPDDDMWVLIHSGSRGVGGLICANFHRMALAHCAATGQTPADQGLAWAGHAGGRPRRCRPLADRGLLLRAGTAGRTGVRLAQPPPNASSHRHHHRAALPPLHAVGGHGQHPPHDATVEEHYGRRVWVHRKGAVKAAAGTLTITPGSMGTGSVLGRGLGNPVAFRSAAHGAGRALSRGRARRELSLQQQLALVEAAGGKVFASSKQGVLDEMPGAYKDLDEVMAHQADLVEPVRRFTPLATYKGTDQPRARRGR